MPKPVTRSKKLSLEVEMPAPSQKATKPTPRPKTRHTAAPTTNADKDKLREEYHSIYDNLEAFKNDVIAAEGRALINAGKALESCLVSIVSFVRTLLTNLW